MYAIVRGCVNNSKTEEVRGTTEVEHTTGVYAWVLI